MAIFAAINQLEILSVAAGLVMTNLVVWLVACAYVAHPDLDMSGWELFRKAPYRVVTWPKLTIALACFASFLVSLAQIRSARDPSALLLTSILLYVIYMAVCVFDADKVLKSYLK
jgi:hypothetical protein